MAQTAPSADAFWCDVASRGWAVADTDVLADDELLEMASGLGPVVISQRGVDALVTTIPVPPAGDDRVIFHSEDGPAGERIDWVKGDTFVCPAWNYHEHFCVGDEQAIHYVVQDMVELSTLRALMFEEPAGVEHIRQVQKGFAPHRDTAH